MTSPSQVSVPRRAFVRRKAVIFCGVVLAVFMGVGVIVAAGRGQPRNDKGGQRQTSDLVEVVRDDFDVSTTASGELRAKNQIEVRNKLESETTILEVVAEGVTVKTGDVLVKLNSEPIQTRVDEEFLALESARAAMVEAEQSYQIQVSENQSAHRQALLKVALAELDLDQWKQGEVKSKGQELDHALDRTAKDETRLAEKYQQSIGLESKGYYSKDQLKQDQLAWEQAKAALEKAKLNKTVYHEFQYPKDKRKRESDVEEARAELERVVHLNESRIASKEADRKNKQHSLAIREAKHTKLREQLIAAVVKAPSDGLVVFAGSLDTGNRWGGNDEGPLQVGKKVYPNELLIVLPDTSEMIAAVKVHESLAGRIRPGQSATVKVDAAGERRFTGRVESVGIMAEQGSRWMDPNLREYTVKIAMDVPAAGAADGKAGSGGSGGSGGGATGAAAHGLKPSMRCEAEIFLGKVSDAVTIPIQAVFSDGLVRYVHMQEGSRYVRRPIQVGQRSDRYAEVRVGLTPGQRVLIRKPEPAEVIAKPWDEAELASVGLKVNEQGTVVPVAGAVPSGAGGPNGGGGRGPRGPGGEGGGGKTRGAGDGSPGAAVPSPAAAPKSSGS